MQNLPHADFASNDEISNDLGTLQGAPDAILPNIDVHISHTETRRKNILTEMRALPEYADRGAASENRENRYLEKMLQQQFGDEPGAGPSSSPPPATST